MAGEYGSVDGRVRREGGQRGVGIGLLGLRLVSKEKERRIALVSHALSSYLSPTIFLPHTVQARGA